jgi:hypothetical protein
MFDGGDFAIVNVRIHRKLRWRRSGNRSARQRHHGRQRGNVRQHVGGLDVGDIELVECLKHIGSLDNLGNAGYGGNVGNVRLRLYQHGFVVDSNLNGAHRGWRCRSNRNSVGIYRDRHSWGELWRSDTHNDRSARWEYRRVNHVATNHSDGYVSANCFIHDGKLIRVPEYRPPFDVEYSGRLLNFS